jgi:hypothetical protein
MSRVWELGGGEYWYSATADRSTKLIGDGGAHFAGGENFEWGIAPGAANNLHWQGLRFTFGNSTVWYNTIVDTLADNAGGGGVYGAGFTDLTIEGDCLYVDVNRTAIVSLTPVKANLANLGVPTIPGSRYIIALRTFNAVWTPLSPFSVGSGGVSHATPATYGSVKLACSAGNTVPPDDAVVPGYEINTHTLIARRISRYNASPIGVGAGTLSIGTIAAFDTALTFASAAVTSTFLGPVVGSVSMSSPSMTSLSFDRSAAGALLIGPTVATSLSFAQAGVVSTFLGPVVGSVSMTSLSFDRSAAGALLIGPTVATSLSFAQASVTSTFYGELDAARGLVATQATADTAAITATGNGTGAGVVATGGATASYGASFTGLGVGGGGVIGVNNTQNAIGVVGMGLHATKGTGVYGVGNGTGYGVFGDGASFSGTNGTGVYGTGRAAGHGVYGLGGAGTGHGVYGAGGTGTGHGVHGEAPSSGGVGLAYAVYGDGSTATTNGTGLYGVGKGAGHGVSGAGGGTGAGVRGEGGTTAGAVGIYGQGGSSGGAGVQGLGVSAGAGVTGEGGTTAGALGVYGQGGSSGGQGGAFVGIGNAVGVRGDGGATSGSGVYGVGISTNAYGVEGYGGATGPGVHGSSAGSGNGVEGVSTTGYGVWGRATGLAGEGVHGQSTSGYGGSFHGNATRSPLHLGTLAAAPGTLADGDIWVQTAGGVVGLCVRVGGATLTFTTSN